MARKRRYDTEALVGQLKAERRTGLLLSAAAVGMLLLLVVLYLLVSDGEESEEVPQSATAAAKQSSEPAKDKLPPEDAAPAVTGSADSGSAAEEGQAGESAAAEAEQKPKAAGPAKVNLQLTRKGVVWLGKKKLGKFKSRAIELPVGTHQVRAKVGRKMVKHTLEVQGGESLELIIDHRTRKVTVKEQ